MRTLQFDTTLTGRFQELQGHLLLQLDGTDLSGTLTIGPQQSFLHGKLLRRGRYISSLRLTTDACQEDCDLLLRIWDSGDIRGYILGEWDSWKLEGALSDPPAVP